MTSELRGGQARLVLDQMDRDDPLPISESEEQRAYPTTIRIPVRLRAMLDDMVNEVRPLGLDFKFNSLVVWLAQIGVEHLGKTLRRPSKKMQQHLAELQLVGRMKGEREAYQQANEAVTEMIKDLSEAVEAGLLDRVDRILNEWDAASSRMFGWRKDIYRRAYERAREDFGRKEGEGEERGDKERSISESGVSSG